MKDEDIPEMVEAVKINKTIKAISICKEPPNK